MSKKLQNKSEYVLNQLIVMYKEKSDSRAKNKSWQLEQFLLWMFPLIIFANETRVTQRDIN